VGGQWQGVVPGQILANAFLIECEQTCINDEPGKSGLSFDLIFSRLQGEVQKSKDIGAELQNLTTALDEIQDTLGGLLVSHTILFFGRVRTLG
jgi:hypothetical protein